MTTNSTFIHLRVHTEYSIMDGLPKVKALAQATVEHVMPAVAITDQCNLFALVKYYKAVVSAGLKPIAGSDFWLENHTKPSHPYRLTLLIKNQQGYANLTMLISQAYLEGQRQGIPYIKEEWVAKYSDGLIAINGAKDGQIGQALLADNEPLAVQLAEQWSTYFPDSFYIEIQRTGRAGDNVYLQHAVNLAAKCNLPLVATNDVRFLKPEDFEAHEARVCIHDSRTLDDPRRLRTYSEEQYLKSPQQMIALFKDFPEAIENTVEIAKRCTFSLKLGENYLPNYPVDEGMTTEQFFQNISMQGLEKRLTKILDPTHQDYQIQRQSYLDRLKFELDIIIQMGFPGYFLIVMDFIKWAKNNDVPVGPGRGSGAGSLVAYSLEITDLDPIHYELLFERFLNPERVSMPDFDIDFCMDGRDKVIDYVARTYGRQAVSQIITFGTMGAKAVVRDVARVQGKPYGLADKLSKMIPFEVGMTLTKALEQEQSLREFVEQNEEVAEIMEMAFKLEGLARNVGKHAGGVVIAPTKLTDFSPLYCDEAGANLVTQYDKDDVEQVGLVKFDFLGLRTLTIIDWAIKGIQELANDDDNVKIDITAIPLDDRKVYQLLQKGHTTAIFQLESRGMKDLICRLLPSTFEDIVALVALFRPGPLQSGMVDDFINRKHGRQKVEYSHPDLEPVLNNTYGVILYQEQVMKIAQVLGNYSLGQADMLRRAMGKKKADEMARQRQIFLEGASTNNIEEQQAGFIFDLMEKFAGYGFNKSHSAAYAMLSYQTAWLKTYYPESFMAAVLSADMQNTDKIVVLIEDCRNMDLPIILPSVNVSQYHFTVNKDNHIIYGLGAIKGLGEGPIQAIITARTADGCFQDLFDFCARIDLKKVNKRALEALVRSGSLDELGPNRAVLMAALEQAVKTSEQHNHNKSVGMVDLFGGVAANNTKQEKQDLFIAYTTVRNWTEKVRLQAEKETLGLYLQGHPFDEYESEMRNIAATPFISLQAKKSEQKLVGLIVGIRVMKSKKGDTIAFLTLDDRTARIEVSVFAEVYNKYKEALIKDTLLIVEGEVGFDDYSGSLKVRANRVFSLIDARIHFAKELFICVHESLVDENFINSLNDILQPYCDGGCPVVLEYQNPKNKVLLQFGANYCIAPNDERLDRLLELFGESKVELRY